MIYGKMYINGSWTSSVNGLTRDIINPYNSEIVANVSEGCREDAELAVSAARDAFDNGEWPGLTGDQRGEYLYRLYELIKRDREELAKLESLDTGKTVEESRWDMDGIADTFKYYAERASEERGYIVDSPIPNTSSIVVKEPVGVCGQISPWNYPLLQASWKIAPALAAGCTVVAKPSEITPLTTLKITELIEEAGIPAGVFNLVLGKGDEVGALLSESKNVDLISFTGGIETGRKIIKSASSNIKKIALELGGKNPNIVFADADFDLAVDFALNAVFFHAGQICSAGTRLMIEDKIHDDFVEALKLKMSKIKLGSGFDKDTQMGPLISEEHRQKIERYVETGINEGAELVLGGKIPEGKEFEKGFFYEPTLFLNCNEDMQIVQQESFGPVITVERFYSEDEAVKKANNTKYGLSAGFWTSDNSRINRVSSKLKFGTVWVNDFNIYFPKAPWGGYKQSGIGRELGFAGLDEYCETKHIYQNFNNSPFKWFG
ncbi:betaine aldehyde dehydrogenase [Flexistipes sinusarabici DSM 4947]|uniref:Betaine-aldehyde dehydrogenase n=1 Tax=Flexistipes sinusarabici (strain ATCC 49648 / DSM 4947 / MAS 10) TaxID=717231 RepID=F8E4F7_FLESM|nr:betaine-aldehyde dehydrogenase [Flexistipes sinusarabici]AEI14443.1 betaine aldehyde dehydrogenase [Flexistipes sinusarabici DSM 4947]